MVQKRLYSWQYRELVPSLESLLNHKISRHNPQIFPQHQKLYNLFKGLLYKKSKLVDQAQLQILIDDLNKQEPNGHHIFNLFNAEMLQKSLEQFEGEEKELPSPQLGDGGLPL